LVLTLFFFLFLLSSLLHYFISSFLHFFFVLFLAAPALVGQCCEEYADKLKDKSLRVCEYHGSKRKKYQQNPKLLGAFDLVVTTYETLGREYANAEKASLKKAASEPWVCELPTSVWNAEKEMDEYTGPPCKHSNDRKHQECQKCGGNVATVAVKQRASNMRRTGEIQAPIEKFFWNRIIADESHGKRCTCWSLFCMAPFDIFFSLFFSGPHQC
jgi:SNF2 family DNA or RNA helicase